MPVEWRDSGEVAVLYSIGDYKLVDGSWWRCTEASTAIVRWESVEPPEFVKEEYRSVDAIRKLTQGE